jgi:hypothetical protein
MVSVRRNKSACLASALCFIWAALPLAAQREVKGSFAPAFGKLNPPIRIQTET